MLISNPVSTACVGGSRSRPTLGLPAWEEYTRRTNVEYLTVNVLCTKVRIIRSLQGTGSPPLSVDHLPSLPSKAPLRISAQASSAGLTGSLAIVSLFPRWRPSLATHTAWVGRSVVCWASSISQTVKHLVCSQWRGIILREEHYLILPCYGIITSLHGYNVISV